MVYLREANLQKRVWVEVSGRREYAGERSEETKDEFDARVNQIYNNLVFFCPDLQKANWEQREHLQTEGWNIRKDLLEGNIPQACWDVFALTRLIPSIDESLPTFCELNAF